jgi:hypothetical protein
MSTTERILISAKKSMWDVSGAFGDIGVLFPLAIALIATNGMNPTAVFLMAGLFYLLSALYFKITMPVQPLKAMSAIAIASGLAFGVINAAGIVMGVVLILIAITGLSSRLGDYFPVAVIRGIQLGLGAMLVRTSFGLMAPNIAVSLVAGVLLISTLLFLKKVPPLIPVLVLGITLAVGSHTIVLPPASLPTLSFGMPSYDSLWTGFVMLVLPQIALTFGNAVVATNNTAKILYREKAERLSLKSVPLSMGIANIVSGFLGGAPMCHGCGGLTAHSKFGATSNRSGLIIGVSLIVFALLFGNSAVAVVTAFPTGILGVLLCYVGIQHALFVRDIMRDPTSLSIAFIVGILGFALSNLTIGFLAGLAIHYGLSGVKKLVSV